MDRSCAVRMRDIRGRGHGLLRAQQPAVWAGRMLRPRPLLRLAAVHLPRRSAQGVPRRGLLSGKAGSVDLLHKVGELVDFRELS